MRFGNMTAKQLRFYRGPIWTARCRIHHRHTGNVVPYDFQERTLEQLVDQVKRARRHLGDVLTENVFCYPGLSIYG